MTCGDRLSSLWTERGICISHTHASKMLPFKLQISNCRQLCTVDGGRTIKWNGKQLLKVIHLLTLPHLNKLMNSFQSLLHVMALHAWIEPKREIETKKSNKMKNDVFSLTFISTKGWNKCVLRVHNFKFLTRACCCCRRRRRRANWTLTIKNLQTVINLHFWHSIRRATPTINEWE